MAAHLARPHADSHEGSLSSFGEDDQDDDEAQNACFCFGGPILNSSWCTASPLVAVDSPPPSPAKPAPPGRSRGALRILVVGSSSEKQRVIDALRAGGSHASRASRATSVGSRFAPVKRASLGGNKSMLIFNDVPSRDLDRPRCNSDFEAYLQRASCALIVVDAGDERWPRDAKRWVERLADSARVPVALLVDLVNFPPAAGATSVPDARRTVETQAAALGAASELPFVGWYVASDDITVDETADCVTAVVDHLDGPADNLGRGSPAKVAGDFLSPARLSQKGPRPSPGTFAESVRASISPSSPF